MRKITDSFCYEERNERIPVMYFLNKLKKAYIDTRGTQKSEVLKGGPKLTKLIEDIVYDTKTFHYVSIVSEELKWVLKEKDSFNVDTGKVKNEIPMSELYQQMQ